jgi:hypothetical protein
MFQRRENSYIRLLNVVCGGCILCAAIPLGFLLILSALYGSSMSVCMPMFGLLEFVSSQNVTSVASECYDSLVYRVVQIHHDAVGTHLTFLVNLLITLGTLVGMVLTYGAPFFLSYLIIQCITEGMYETGTEAAGEPVKHCDEAKQEHQL